MCGVLSSCLRLSWVLSAVRSLNRGHGDSGYTVPTVTKLGGGWQDCGEYNSQSCENIYQAMNLLYNSRQTWFTTPIFRGALDINWTKQRGCPRLSFSVVVCVFALNGWITGCSSVPAWIRRTRGVSLLWGLCEALWGRRLVSGCMFPIGCFCWAKTQWGSGLFKEAVSLFVCARVWFFFFLSVWCWLHHISLMKHWWAHLTLMADHFVWSKYEWNLNASVIQRADLCLAHSPRFMQ